MMGDSLMSLKVNSKLDMKIDSQMSWLTDNSKIDLDSINKQIMKRQKNDVI